MQTLLFEQATRSKSDIQEIGRARRRSDLARDAIDRSMFVLVGELCLAATSYLLAVVLAGQMRGPGWAAEVIRSTGAVVVASRLGASLVWQLYRRSLRYASALDLIAIVKAVLLSSLLLWVVGETLFRRLLIPNGVFFADATVLLISWTALHFGPRVWKSWCAASRKHGKRVVIVGAGDAGISVLKELALDPTSSRRPVAIVDDNPSKWGRTVYGIPILGGIKNLARIAADNGADEILICIPSATRSQMRDVLRASRSSNLPVRSLPCLSELIDMTGGADASQRYLRNPRIEDLLQREEVRVDPDETRRLVADKTVLVTGAGGSIGSELCRQIAAGEPRRLLLLDKSENSLFYVHLEASEQLDAARVKPFLVDLLHTGRVEQILGEEQPDIVFHAAAYKHVAMLEMHPEEAIRNNVLGTRYLAETASEFGVGRFVNISTDKAVNPCSYLGLSKKISEMCVRELAFRAGAIGSRSRLTQFSSVRFGNVAGSTGSVLRLFRDQIQRGGPVRVSDPRATRYFMSVPEAVHLILRAAALGRGGETFVLDMGEPVNICELARTLMLFAGVRPNVDMPIEFTGLKKGEKITEELWDEGELPEPTESDRVLVVGGVSDWPYPAIEAASRMEDFLRLGDRAGLLDYIHEAFPGFAANRANSVLNQMKAPEAPVVSCEGVA